MQMAGQIERLARTRYEITKLIPQEPTLWDGIQSSSERLGKTEGITLSSEQEIIEPLAQSVWASTEIEGESVLADDLRLAIVGKPSPNQRKQEDYAERVRGTNAVYAAYIWALSQNFPLAGNKVVTPDFLLELHKRMFSSTKVGAGEWKKKSNLISWGGSIEIHVLSPERVTEFVDRLCDRINACFSSADTAGGCCRLLSVAEFIVDFLAIHPFTDGNGRIARLLSTYLLERAGYHFARFYPLDTIILERQQRYYRALFESQSSWHKETEDLTPWIEFYLNAVFTQWLRAHEAIRLSSSASQP